MEILVTNDDGVNADGIRALARAMSDLGRVTIVAPDRERSATSHSLTLRNPLSVHWLEERVAAVSGTPTDCVLLAIHDLLPRRPDVVVSGVNHGANLGDDVMYSGTVAAAYEGTLLGVPSIAVSLVPAASGRPRTVERLDAAAALAVRMVQGIVRFGLPRGTLLNLNVPGDPPAPGAREVLRWTRLGKRLYLNVVRREEDHTGEPVFTIGGEPSWHEEEGTDFAAIQRGECSVSPVRWSLTDHEGLRHLETWRLEELA
jgi:5'-nucleotidase